MSSSTLASRHSIDATITLQEIKPKLEGDVFGRPRHLDKYQSGSRATFPPFLRWLAGRAFSNCDFA
jgi:transposase-like protein